MYAVVGRTSDEDQIREKFAKATELASFTKLPPLVEQLQQSKELAEFFTPTIHVRSEAFGEEHEFTGKEQFRQRIQAGRAMLSSLEARVRDFQFTIKDDRADVEATVSILGSMPGVEGQFFEEHRVRMGLVDDGGWHLQSVEHLKNLREKEDNS